MFRSLTAFALTLATSLAVSPIALAVQGPSGLNRPVSGEVGCDVVGLAGAGLFAVVVAAGSALLRRR